MNRLEELEKQNASLQSENENLKKSNKDYDETNWRQLKYILKLTKVIEILKIKRVSIHILLETNSVAEYNFCVDYNQLLTQEEYELLKEVLGND